MHRWGESDAIITFEGTKTSRLSTFPSMDIAIWRAQTREDVTILNTMGMSEKLMPGALSPVELNLGCRLKLKENDERELAHLLANITEYPFANNIQLDWWHRLAHPGSIPVFSNCTAILFAPSFAEPESSWLDVPATPIKLLYVIPITEHENHILHSHGLEAFEDYLDQDGIDLFCPPVGKRANPPSNSR